MSQGQDQANQQGSDSDEPQKKCAKTEADAQMSKLKAHQTPVMRVIAVLPSYPVRRRSPDDDSDESSDDNGSDIDEGLVETSDSDSAVEEGIPFPTKPKVIVPRTKAAEEHHNHH